MDGREVGRESDERFRAILEHSADLIALVGRDGAVQYASRSVERMLGYPTAGYLGQRLFWFIHPDDVPDVTARFEESVARPGAPIGVAFRHRHRDGTWRCLDGVWVNRLDEPAVGAVVGSWRDVTDRKRAEEALRESEERYRLLAAHSLDLVAVIDLKGNFLYVSPSHAHLLGCAPDSLVGRGVPLIVHVDDLRSLFEVVDEVAASGASRKMELRLLRKGGDWIEVEAFLSPIRHGGEAVNRILISARDITERKRAEQALRDREEQFRAVFDTAAFGVARLDLEGRVVDCNRGLLEISGYQRDEIEGRAFTDFIHPEDKLTGLADFRALAEGRRDHYQVERRYYRKDGQLMWANVTVSLVRDPDERPRFCIAMLENITERKQAEEALRQSNRRLTGWVTELEQRTREISVLSEMGELLQACRSPDEAYGVIGRMARQLFPLEHGVLCVTGAQPNLVDAVATWGMPVGERTFAPDECWALRRGRVHVVEDTQLGLICRHMHRPLAAPYVCIPMMAQGESLGVLTLSLPELGRSAEAKQRLAQTVAEHIALALANLKLQESLRMQSIRDPLTGLFNRRYMEESLERETRRASRGRHPVGIIMLDLDHFKDVNDQFGHEAGDCLLQEVGSVLQRSIRGEDIACRYGGEEFTLILPEASLADAVQRAERIRGAIKSLKVQYRKATIGSITASLGVAVYPDHGPTGVALLAAADAALYQAKARGRDRVAFNPGGGTAEVVDVQEN